MPKTGNGAGGSSTTDPKKEKPAPEIPWVDSGVKSSDDSDEDEKDEKKSGGFLDLNGEKTTPYDDFTGIEKIKEGEKPVLMYFHSTNEDEAEKCKAFEEALFKIAEVAEFIKDNFACVRMDTEEMEEDMRKDYKVTRIPKVVFYDYKGKYLYNYRSSRPKASTFLAIMKKALSRNQRALEKAKK